MDYLMHFDVLGLDDPARAALLKKLLSDLSGVKEVQIDGTEQMSILYDSTKVTSDKMTALMRMAGVRVLSG